MAPDPIYIPKRKEEANPFRRHVTQWSSPKQILLNVSAAFSLVQHTAFI
jgi:hypothetical protein